MQIFFSNLALVIGWGTTLVASILSLLWFEVLLVARANRYLVLVSGRRKKQRYRVLEKGVYFRIPFWQKVAGEAPRGEQVLEWDIGDTIVWQRQDESCILEIPAYVISVRVWFTSNPDMIERIALGQLDPLSHLHDCVQEAVIQPGREPLGCTLATSTLKDWFKLNPTAEHGYTVESVCSYTERI